VERGEFRDDLFYRLKVVSIFAPALRDRREDIPLLVHHFLEQTQATHGKRSDGLTRNAVELLQRYTWPGNVRELRNVVEGMVVMARGAKPLDVDAVPPHVRARTQPEVSEMRSAVGTSMAE